LSQERSVEAVLEASSEVFIAEATVSDRGIEPGNEMPKRDTTSAGLLLFRRAEKGVEFFLAHPGGPFWRNRHEEAWTIPKGVLEPGEEPLAAAIREFREETGVRPLAPYIDLGSVRQKGGKTVHAWAWEGTADPEGIVSNEARMEWPRNSGRWITYPEVDRCGWYTYDEAVRLINPAQVGFLDALLRKVDFDAAQAKGEGPDLEPDR
jgi:predicted NUDIX family NTP pyrophosphohydrolase